MKKTFFFILLIHSAFQGNSARAMSLEEEIKLGREEFAKLVAQGGGPYRDQKLQKYVNEIGQSVAAQSSRKEIDYTFTLLDSDVVNAFALPGGFIAISRGLLVNLQSEAELAMVIGHEIAHVTEKHALRRNLRKKSVDILSQVAGALSGQRAIAELGSTVGLAYIQGYSRENELEADKIGAQYVIKAGYSSSALPVFIGNRKSAYTSEIREARLENRQPKIRPGLLATHPDLDLRYEKAMQISKDMADTSDQYIGKDEFLQRINGLAIGPSKRIGVVRRNTFYHPRLGIKFNFPRQWRYEAQPNGIALVSRNGDAILSLDTARFAPDTAVARFASDMLGFSVREGREITITGMPAYLGIADRADSRFGSRPVRFAVIFDMRKRIGYIFMGAGQHDLRKIARDRDFIASIFSFDRMNRDDFTVAKLPKIQLIRAEDDITMEQLAQESPITNYALDRLRVMNGLYPDSQPEPGQLIKIIN